jgi:mannose-6-phosphate isomerase-like protein (cupin superfamily)
MAAALLPDLIEKKKDYDYLAPDTAEIRLLLTDNDAAHASLCHVTLPVGKTSIAAKHQTVEELWYFVAGKGELWLKSAVAEVIYPVKNGSAITIPAGVGYQFRNLSYTEALEFIVTTIPHWPGPQEVILVEGKWQSSVMQTTHSVST